MARTKGRRVFICQLSYIYPVNIAPNRRFLRKTKIPTMIVLNLFREPGRCPNCVWLCLR